LDLDHLVQFQQDLFNISNNMKNLFQEKKKKDLFQKKNLF